MTAPVLILLRRFLRLRELDRIELLETCGLVGLLGLLLIALGGSILTTIGVIRFLAYAPLYTVAALSAFLGRQRRWAIAAGLFLVFLSVPTQFAFNRNAALHRYYPTDISVGKFLESTYGVGDGLALFSGGQAGLLHHLYRASWSQEADTDILLTAQGYWRDLQRLVNDFISAKHPRAFVLSTRIVVPYRSIFGVSRDDGRWAVLPNQLSSSDRIYDNGDAEVFI
jgi:hypothetical protein